jgi:hypothetical protein
MKSHSKSKKHQNGGKREAMTEEQLKEYHKRYYIEKNLKDKYKEKKKCECCDKMVAKYNWSKHIQTEKHFKKYHAFNNPEPPYVRDRLIKDDDNKIVDLSNVNVDDIIDPLTVKREDLIDIGSDTDTTPNIEFTDSDSEDEIGEVMKEVMEIEKMPFKFPLKKIIKKPTKK